MIANTTLDGNISVYGLSSIFIPHDHDPKILEEETLDFANFHSDTFLEHISNFFRWRYPGFNAFVHRESFLTDFFKDKTDIKESLPYCSEELIYAICALGCTDRKLSVEFYARSKNIMFNKLQSTNSNSITTIQTLLCLAVYDLGKGDTSSAWLQSGMAFRIGQDMGFELDPSNWKLPDSNFFSEYDLLVRNRIFWGCFVVDRFLSLILGRSCTLELSKTTLAESKDLPRLKGIEVFQYSDPLEPDYDIRMDVSGIMKFEIELFNLFFEYSQNLFELDQLGDFNLKSQRWRQNLPAGIRWTKSDLSEHGHNPVKMNIPLCYYMIVLTLNRFQPALSRNLLSSTVDEVYLIFKSFIALQGLAHGSLKMVYIVILVLEILEANDKRREFFGMCLKNLSIVWEVAEKYYTSHYS
jgi:hypothetical protein